MLCSSHANTRISPRYINNQQIHFNIHNVFYSQYSRRFFFSAGIPTIFRIMFLLQEYKMYKYGELCYQHSVTIKTVTNTSPMRSIKTHHITASVIAPHRLNNFNSKNFNKHPFLTYSFITHIMFSEITILIVMECW